MYNKVSFFIFNANEITRGSTDNRKARFTMRFLYILNLFGDSFKNLTNLLLCLKFEFLIKQICKRVKTFSQIIIKYLFWFGLRFFLLLEFDVEKF